MAGRREMITRDRQRNSTARKLKHKRIQARSQQQADVMQRLYVKAKEEAKASA